MKKQLMTGLLASLVATTMMLNSVRAADKSMPSEMHTLDLKNRISTHVTDGAPFMVHHLQIGTLEVCAIFEFAGGEPAAQSDHLCSHYFQGLLGELQADGIDVDEVCHAFMKNSVSLRHTVKVMLLVIDPVDQKIYVGDSHCSSEVLGLEECVECHYLKLDGDIEPRPYQSETFNFSEVQGGKIVLCGPNLTSLIRLKRLCRPHLFQAAVPGEDSLSPAENLVKFASWYYSEPRCFGFAAIVVDLSPASNEIQW